MSKKRIYEYAKELNVKSKEIIDELKNMNVEVSNHMQALEDDQIKTLDKKFRQQESNNNTKQNTQNNHLQSTIHNINQGKHSLAKKVQFINMLKVHLSKKYWDALFFNIL